MKHLSFNGCREKSVRFEEYVGEFYGFDRSALNPCRFHIKLPPDKMISQFQLCSFWRQSSALCGPQAKYSECETDIF